MNDPRTTLSRPIVATFHRKAGRRTKAGETRRYAKIDNALPRATQLLMWDGAPGDVVEFSHALTGKPLGSVKIKAGGMLDSWFLWEK